MTEQLEVNHNSRAIYPYITKKTHFKTVLKHIKAVRAETYEKVIYIIIIYTNNDNVKFLMQRS